MVVATLLLLTSACAAPAPVTVEPAFRDVLAGAAGVGAASARCRLQVAEILDARRAPDMLGVVDRAVRAPADRAAWLRSVVAGLSSRGFTLDFDAASPVTSRALVLRLTLVSSWVSATSVNKNANVVWRVVAERANMSTMSKEYRGAVSTVNWTDGAKELTTLVDQAFARSLDAMAPDLHGFCGA